MLYSCTHMATVGVKGLNALSTDKFTFTPTAANKDGGPTGSISSCRAKDCGMTWTTNHKKATVLGLVSHPITTYVLLSDCLLLDVARLPCRRCSYMEQPTGRRHLSTICASSHLQTSVTSFISSPNLIN